MVKLFLVLALAMTVASQPLDTIATSGGATLTTQLWNWAQVGIEALLELAKRFLDSNTEEEDITSEHIFTILFCPNWNILLQHTYKSIFMPKNCNYKTTLEKPRVLIKNTFS